MDGVVAGCVFKLALNICFALYYDGPDEYTINALANYINVMIGQGVLHLHSKGNEPKFI